ncbi:hypothetical protein Vretimale_12704 [Volvox reticuliferus]|uniref:Uncharacterized protein n=1 Tax=Volvox reticuliferus TaxID=1737510 RepID=A0A8J4LS78_9CHLO|nr:hypothetical protein Vretimale_12704 [Volvox reticuliferus]
MDLARMSLPTICGGLGPRTQPLGCSGLKGSPLPLSLHLFADCSTYITRRSNDARSCHGDRMQQRTLRQPCFSRSVPGNLEYGGYCTCCHEKHILRATPAALLAAKQLMERLDTEGRIDFDALTPDPVLHIDYVWTKGPGRMFGVMVCTKTDGDGEDVEGAGVVDNELTVLKAFSGQISNYWHVPGWVGPVATITNATPLYHNYRALTEAHSARLASLDLALQYHRHARGPQRQRQASRRAPKLHPGAEALENSGEAFLQRQRELLRARRRALSHELLGRIQDSYRICTFTGQKLRLLDVYAKAVHRQQRGQQYERKDEQRAREAERPLGSCTGSTGPTAGSEWNKALAFPAGTGDCCAPKLLSACIQRGLTPLGMVEFWYGSPPNTATAQGRSGSHPGLTTRVHGEMYGMCEKCECILGSMLCGAPAAALSSSSWGGNAGTAGTAGTAAVAAAPVIE